MSPLEQIRLIFISALLIIITQTLSILAIRHQKQNPILSLPLHFHNPNIDNHTSPIMSRFEADTARANYLNSRLRNALFKSKPGFEAEKIQTPVARLGGEYVATIGVGEPATEVMSLVIDSGSEIIWLKCPGKSSSYQTLSCAAPQCGAEAREIGCNTDTGTCAFKSTYGDQSFSAGDFVTETLSFGSSGSVKNIAIGCENQVEGKALSFNGIIGLGPNSVSLPSQLKATSFSYCMAGSSSESTSSTLDFNLAAPSDSITVRMVRNPRADFYYYVELIGITVGNDQFPVPYQIGSDGRGGVIVDSGTTYTLLDQQVYDSVLQSFRKNAQDLQSSPVPEGSGSEACYSIPAGTTVNVPVMSFQFSDGQTLELAPENYLRQEKENVYCLTFQPTDQIVSIIGNVSQKGMRVTYDLVNKKIGFSPNKC